MKKRIFYILFCVLIVEFGYSQSDSAIEKQNILDIGLFPKQESPELYNFKVSGYYRFFGTYTDMHKRYELTPANEKTVFIGDDSQLPNLMMNFSGRPSKNTSWGFDLYTFQFLNGSINPAYSGQVADSLLPSIYDPIGGTRMAGNLGIHLGINLYGNFETSFGSLGVKAGGIHWVSMSDLTLASFKGYNRFMLFEPNPWDPVGNTVSKRYTDFFESGNIKQDERWGEKAFVGLILEGENMPGKTSFKAMAGKTELNGGYLYVPNFSYGGQIRKQINEGFVGINTFNSFTYKDSLQEKTAGFNLATLEAQAYIKKFMVHLETGAGKYFAPQYDGGWGEAINLKVRTPEIEGGYNVELHAFRLGSEIINNSAVFWNTSIVEGISETAAETTASEGVLQPFASSMVELGMMTNNRQGFDLNAEIPIKNFKISGAIGASSEIKAISNQLTYNHVVNQLTRSRFWRWDFPSDVGPYNRYTVGYRNVYEVVNLTDDELGEVINKKHFSGAELQAKAHFDVLNRKLFVFSISRISTAQPNYSVIPVFTEDAYIRQYSNELEAYWFISNEFIFNTYIGYERTIANYDTEVNILTGKPRNQYGKGLGLGVDYSLGRNAVLMLRHRWFSFEDENFEKDKFKGTETVLELKVMF